MYTANQALKTIQVGISDNFAMIKLKTGKMRKQEFYFGSSFLSQSTRSIMIGPDIAWVEIFNNKDKYPIIFFMRHSL